jgi:Carboxypeptidase regulatory-like domain
MNRKLFTVLLSLLAQLAFSDLSLSAQTLTSATIVGTVADASGAVIADTVVSIQQKDTGAVRTTKTCSDEEYRFPFLKPGEYVVTVTSSGLNASPVAVQPSVGKEQAIDITLGVQSVAQSISVTTNGSQIQTETGTPSPLTRSNMLKIRR